MRCPTPTGTGSGSTVLTIQLLSTPNIRFAHHQCSINQRLGDDFICHKGHCLLVGWMSRSCQNTLQQIRTFFPNVATVM